MLVALTIVILLEFFRFGFLFLALHAKMEDFPGQKIFILVSTVMTWACSKAVDPVGETSPDQHLCTPLKPVSHEADDPQDCFSDDIVLLNQMILFLCSRESL